MNTKINTPVIINMMVGAGALSRKKLIYVPNNVLAMLTPTATINMLENLRVTKNAIAPGAINNPIARIMPVAASVATIVSDNAASKP